MKLIKINTDHYVVVDDSEIKEGDWVVGCTRTVVQCMYPENVHHRDVKKITHSTQPLEEGITIHDIEHKRWILIKYIDLQEVKELIGEVDVTTKAVKDIEGTSWDEDAKPSFLSGYLRGYRHALEDNKEKKYTEEDIRKAYDEGYSVRDAHGDRSDNMTSDEYVKSLQPKTEWEVEIVDGKLKLKL